MNHDDQKNQSQSQSQQALIAPEAEGFGPTETLGQGRELNFASSQQSDLLSGQADFLVSEDPFSQIQTTLDHSQDSGEPSQNQGVFHSDGPASHEPSIRRPVVADESIDPVVTDQSIPTQKKANKIKLDSPMTAEGKQTMPIKISVPEVQELTPRIVVFGVGGAGGNAVNNMISNHLNGVEFVVANTDAQALTNSAAERRIQLGGAVTQGLGAGSIPDVGRAAAEESAEEIMDHLQGCHMAFIAAGMGGGTGTGAAPVLARLAREAGVLTVGVVTKPFQFEGTRRMRSAEAGIEELQKYVDTLIVIPNQNLFCIANEKTTFAQAFQLADNVLAQGVRGITDLMINPGLVNLDFADVKTVMHEMGKAVMGTGEAEGEDRAMKAAQMAISNPLLEDITLQGAKGVLISIAGGMDMTLHEVDDAAKAIREEVDADANIIFGTTLDMEMEGKIRVSLIATGMDVDISTINDRNSMRLDDMVGKTVQEAEAALDKFSEATVKATAQPSGQAPAQPAEQSLPLGGSQNDDFFAMPATSVPTPSATSPMPNGADKGNASTYGTEAALGQPDPFRAADMANAGHAAPTANQVPVMTQPQQGYAPQAQHPQQPQQPQQYVAQQPGYGHGQPAGAHPTAASTAYAPEPVVEESKKPNLFDRLRGKKAQPAETAARAGGQQPQAQHPQAQPQQTEARVTKVSHDGPMHTQSVDDELDIPAFLRRQAN